MYSWKMICEVSVFVGSGLLSLRLFSQEKGLYDDTTG